MDVHWFLENACPDHHVRGRSDHNEALHTAMRMLEHHPEIARENFITAVVCGELEYVRAALAERPELARLRPPGDEERANSGGMADRYYRKLGPKGWDPILFLTHTRLARSAVAENAVGIAKLLLDNGANPNAFFMAGDSRYTPLVGVIGEGEEDRPPHPRRDELARLLLERGAEPYDEQVLYNIHFRGNVLWWFELMYEFSLRLGRAKDWEDPSWSKLPMGVYGPGATFWHRVAAQHENSELTQWLIAHGAAAPAPVQTTSGYAEFAAAAKRLDRETARRIAEEHPEYLKRTEAIFWTTQSGRDRADVAKLLLDLGVSPDVENQQKERPLHMAAYGDAVGVGELLIARGAEIDPVEKNWNNTPLDAAIYMQSRRMIALLGRHSRDPYRLAYAGQTERLRELLAENPELAKIKTEGTLLMWLPPESDERAAAQIELLLSHGADPNIKDKSGHTAADYAEKQELVRTATLLRRAMSRKKDWRSDNT